MRIEKVAACFNSINKKNNMKTNKINCLNEIKTNNGNAIINFETFLECEDFVSKCGGEIHEFKIKDGQNVWQDCGHEFEPFNLELFYAEKSSNYFIYTNADKEDAPKEIEDLIKNLTDDEMLFLYENGETEIKQKKTMSLSYDTTRREIGVLGYNEEKYYSLIF